MEIKSEDEETLVLRQKPNPDIESSAKVVELRRRRFYRESRAHWGVDKPYFNAHCSSF